MEKFSFSVYYRSYKRHGKEHRLKQKYPSENVFYHTVIHLRPPYHTRMSVMSWSARSFETTITASPGYL